MIPLLLIQIGTTAQIVADALEYTAKEERLHYGDGFRAHYVGGDAWHYESGERAHYNVNEQLHYKP